MKTKILLMLLVATLLVACDNTPYPEKDVKAIIKNRVNCVKVDFVSRSQGVDYCWDTYVAIDSTHNTYAFRANEEGVITLTYKNGQEVK